MEILLDKIMYQKNLSVRQVSYMTGIPRSTISDIICGRTSPRLDTLEAIAKGLYLHITELFESPYK